MSKRPIITMRVVSAADAEGRTCIDMDPAAAGTVIFQGVKRILRAPNWLCGSCGAVLVSALGTDRIQDVILRCRDCRAFNALPPGYGKPGVQ